jgi:hypothetical protein
MTQGPQQLSHVLAGMGFFPSEQHDSNVSASEISASVPEQHIITAIVAARVLPSENTKSSASIPAKNLWKNDHFRRSMPAALVCIIAFATSYILHSLGLYSIGNSYYKNDYCKNSFSLRDLNLTSLVAAASANVQGIQKPSSWKSSILGLMKSRSSAGDQKGVCIFLVRKDIYLHSRLERCSGYVQTGYQDDVLHLGSILNSQIGNVKKVFYFGSIWDDTKQNAFLSFLMSPASKDKDPSDWVFSSFNEALQRVCSIISLYAESEVVVARDVLVPLRMCTLYGSSKTISSTMRLANLLHDSYHGQLDIDMPLLTNEMGGCSSYIVVIAAMECNEAISLYKSLGNVQRGTVIIFVVMGDGGSNVVGLNEISKPFLQCTGNLQNRCWILETV